MTLDEWGIGVRSLPFSRLTGHSNCGRFARLAKTTFCDIVMRRAARPVPILSLGIPVDGSKSSRALLERLRKTSSLSSGNRLPLVRRTRLDRFNQFWANLVGERKG